MTCPTFKMFQSSVFLFLVCLSVCLLHGGLAELQKVHFRTKHLNDGKAGPVEEKTHQPSDASGTENETMQSRESGYFCKFFIKCTEAP